MEKTMANEDRENQRRHDDQDQKITIQKKKSKK
jgi:hypothetical protein